MKEWLGLGISAVGTGGGGGGGGGGGKSAVLGDWSRCSSSSLCFSGCCTSKYSNGELKCTPLSPGFNPSANGCVASAGGNSGGGGGGGGGNLGDWSRCSSSSQCSNGCCTSKYSNGVLKCTPLSPGYNPSANGCVGGRLLEALYNGTSSDNLN